MPVVRLTTGVSRQAVVGTHRLAARGRGFVHLRPRGVVELEGGVRTAARIEGVEAAKPESIKLGIPVSAVYLHRGEGEEKRTYVAFKPA